MGFLDTVKGWLGGAKSKEAVEAPKTGEEAPKEGSSVQDKLQALINETKGYGDRVKAVMSEPGMTPTAAPTATPVAPDAPSVGILTETAPAAAAETSAAAVNPMPVNAALGTPMAMPTPANEVKMPEAPTVDEKEGSQAA